MANNDSVIPIRTLHSSTVFKSINVKCLTNIDGGVEIEQTEKLLSWSTPYFLKRRFQILN